MKISATRAQITVLALTSTLIALNLFFKMVPSVLSKAFEVDFALSNTALAAISSATMLGFGLMQIPSGVITDFWGGRKTLSILFTLAALSVLLFSVTSSAPVAVGSRFTLGLGIAVTVPGLTLLAQWFHGKSFATANGILLTCGAMGTLLSSGPVAYASAAFGWRPVLFAMGLLSLGLAWLVWRLIPSRPPVVAQLESKSMSVAAIMDNIRQVARRKMFWLLAVWMACVPGMGMAFMALWWGKYLMDGCGMSQTEAGTVLMVIFFLGLPMMLVMSWLYASVLPDRRKIFTLASLGCMGVVALLMWACGKNSMVLHIGVGALFNYLSSGTVTILYASTKELFPLRMVGTALGCINTVLPVGCMVIQSLFGLIMDHGSDMAAGDAVGAYVTCLWIFMGCSVISLVAAWFMTSEIHHEPPVEVKGQQASS